MILDCTDNVDIRNALDRVCEKAKIPLVSGAAIRLEGQVSIFTYEPNTQPIANSANFWTKCF